MRGTEGRAVDIRVSPATDLAPGFVLVTFDSRSSPNSAAFVPANSEPATQQLEQELEQTKRQFRVIVEQHEASDEEMKASNEELQAMNEELRSATEELETSTRGAAVHQ